MTDKSQKITKLVVAAAGVSIGIFLIAKYHKNLLQKLKIVKNSFLDLAKIPRNQLQIEIINDPNECRHILANLKKQSGDVFNVLGFDCEWVSVNNQRRKVALIQLCSSEGFCALFRLCKFTKIPLELREILEDPEIIKTGITPLNDANHLYQDYNIKMNGTFDLRFLALLAGKKPEGLGKLSKSILNIEIDKDWRVRCSDWEAPKLTDKQVDYAAKDAYVAVEIFKKLYCDVKPSEMTKISILQFCDNYTDIMFKNKMSQMNFEPTNEQNSPRTSQHKNNNNNKNKDINQILKRAYSTRATPLYDNCLLEAPDGVLLCTCDKKKAEWYVEKGLGVEIGKGQGPFTVRLNFEPAGRAVGEVGKYYQSIKENRCVVCGKEQELIRKNVVPREYRKHFPQVLKDKTSHDVLLLCIYCHQLSNISDINLRKQLEVKCDAPIYEIPDDMVEVKKFRNIQKMARALVKQDKIPESRKLELHEKIREFFPEQEITNEFLNDLMKMEEPIKPSSSKPMHGELVVKRFKEVEGLTSLEKLWRQHFLDVMKPNFLPELWNVNHNANRLEIRATEGRVDPDDLKIAGVDAIIIPKVEIHEPESPPENDFMSVNDNRDDVDSSSDWEFRSAAGSRMDNDRTLTEDEHYFSDAPTIASCYETIMSDGSTVDLSDFQSFASSLTQQPNYDSDSRSSLFSQDFSIDSDSDTEVEEDVKQLKV